MASAHYIFCVQLYHNITFSSISFIYYCLHYIVYTNADIVDFIATTNQVTFSGATKQCTSFSIVDDDIAVEGSETFNVVIKPPYGVQAGSIDKAEITILDNDGKYYY